MSEVASRVAHRKEPTPGQNYARRRGAVPEKEDVRRKLVAMLGRRQYPQGLSLVTMPSIEWRFEWTLLQTRETRPTIVKARDSRGSTRRTYFCALEDDPAMYLAALRSIPGGKHNISEIEAAPFASRSLKSPLVQRFHLATAERFMAMVERPNHVAWLDFNGPLTEVRIDGLRRLWNEGLVTDLLAVTVMDGRMSRTITSQVDQRGGIGGLLQNLCQGAVVRHMVRYHDTSPMVHIVLGRPS